MKFIASIDIMPHKELLDPQGKTVLKNLSTIDINGVGDVRIGKHIEMQLDAENKEGAQSVVEMACKKMFANEIMETYNFTLTEVS